MSLFEITCVMITSSLVNILGGAAVAYFTGAPMGLGSFAFAILWGALLTPIAILFAAETIRDRNRKSPDLQLGQ